MDGKVKPVEDAVEGKPITSAQEQALVAIERAYELMESGEYAVAFSRFRRAHELLAEEPDRDFILHTPFQKLCSAFTKSIQTRASELEVRMLAAKQTGGMSESEEEETVYEHQKLKNAFRVLSVEQGGIVAALKEKKIDGELLQRLVDQLFLEGQVD